MNISVRKATQADSDFIWALYLDLLKEPVTKQWGWEEAYQRRMFAENLPYTVFAIVMVDGVNVAAYALLDKTEFLHLRMLLVARSHQNLGIGRQLMQQIKARAIRENKALHFSVIKANPVREFYTKLGFRQSGEDESCYLFHSDFIDKR